MSKFVKRKMPVWGKPAWNSEDLKFVKDNCEEMSTTELAHALGCNFSDKDAMVKAINKVRGMCSKRGFSYFSETPSNFKKKGYIEGPDDYIMYPYKGGYRQSVSVKNSMLTGA